MSDSDKMERLDDGVSKESDLYQKPPSMFQMLRTFSKEVVKYVGALYLFYLGVKSLLYRRDNE